MLNTERIRLMTRLAAYEQGEGKEYGRIGRYYRHDYVGLQMIKVFFCSTAAFLILLVLSVLYQMEDLERFLYQMDYEKFASGLLTRYILFVVFYQAAAWIVYSLRYRKGSKEQKLYHSRLKKVEKLYEREERQFPGDD